MANMYGVDLARQWTAGQNVLGMNERRETQGHINNAYKRQDASRPLLGKMLGGDDEAATMLRESDPQAWIQGRGQLAQMEKGERDGIQQMMQQAAVGLAAIEGAPPAEQQSRYQQLYGILPPEVQKIMPETYTPESGQQMMAYARGFDGLVKEADRAATFSNAKGLASHKSGLDRGTAGYKATLDRETNRLKSASDAKAIKTGMSPKEILQARKDAKMELSGAITGLTAAKKVMATLSVPGAITDVATIFSAMKALDPTSVVRESEFDMMSKAGGLYEGLKGSVAKAKGDGFITEKTRKNMEVMINELVKLYDENAAMTKKYWSGFADRAEVNPDHIIGGLVPTSPLATNEPAQSIDMTEAAKYLPAR